MWASFTHTGDWGQRGPDWSDSRKYVSPVAGLSLWADYPAEPILGPRGNDVCGSCETSDGEQCYSGEIVGGDWQVSVRDVWQYLLSH